ncbi:hypothetical protein [Bradyrhizobium sp.]|uniref:hypothetical protein n=1 Tax=Bradyrhizobium sp. TaxID=376 RepID=UPI002614890C|nr:hypothetical protein [Bradyrhizobium sp.]
MARFALKSAVCALSLLTASSALANVYTLSLDHCSGTGGCAIGSDSSYITAVNDGANLDINVYLLGGDVFMHGPTGKNGKNTFGFDLNLSSITFGSITSPFVAVSGISGSNAMDGAGKYDYAINYPGRGGPTTATLLSFVINGASVSDISNIAGVFAADIRSGTTGNTGVVEFSAAVPETSTWAMMLLGFASLGFATYRKARKPAAFAA